MKVIVCGGSGLLGRDLCKKLKQKNIDYIGTYNNNPIENGVNIDFKNINNIELFFNEIKPTICVNCIAERRLEICETDWKETKITNIDIVNNLAKICYKLNIHLIHLSSDYVFDGSTPPYYPESKTNPLQNYGISKLVSEKRVIANCKKYTIIRVPVLYTDTSKVLDNNAITLIGKKVLNRIEKFSEDNYSIRRPNYIPDFCNFIIEFIIDPKIGIYHFCNPYDKFTKYEISRIISDYLNKKHTILPIDNESANNTERPIDTHLKDDNYDITKYYFTPFVIGLEKCFSRFWHPKLEINSDMNTKDIFFMIDLDGTIIDTDKLHYQGYIAALKNYDKFLTYNEYINIVNNEGIDNYLNKHFFEYKYQIKDYKNFYIKNCSNDIRFIQNADNFIHYILIYNINYVIVTNTSNENVKFFKEKLPLLNELKNWVVREDYNNPKPNSECYALAKQKYYNNEKSIIGIENSIVGYNSIKNFTDCVYIITSKNDCHYEYFKRQDVYLIDNYVSIFE
jgi:dTDP-4-dehydrorhamnose reductase/beta-phosphoglucomutase-like phosphatase (HAD superfamily)